jgi:fibronectin type 3 domain-containing protein
MKQFARLGFCALILLAGTSCSTDTDAPTFDNPFDPVNGSGLPVPESIVVTVGNNQIRLKWSLPEGQSAEEFAVFRKRLDLETGTSPQTQLIAQVSDTTYIDSGARNGRVYGYTIAAGQNGQFGTRSEQVDAVPNLFTIVIDDDAPKTRLRTVDISLTGPSNVAAIMIAEDQDFTGASWQQAAATISWTVTPGDGLKRIYGRFQLSDGSESFPVSDSIVLDTQAVIKSIDFEGSAVRSPGDQIHFVLNAEEQAGTASVEVPGLFPATVSLFDDGTNGDRVAGDGVYERDILIPSATVSQVAVTGRFTDDAGNQASATRAPRTLSVQQSPDPVTVLGLEAAVPPAAAAITLRWSQYQGPDFSAYQIFRSESAPVDSSDRLIRTTPSLSSQDYQDTDVIEGHTYFYRVYVLNSSGLSSGSNTSSLQVPNLRPPDTVQMTTPTATSSTRIALQWSQSNARDFASYRIYRNLSGAVTSSDPLIAEMTDVDQIYLDDTNLVENTEYFYRVYVLDEGSLSSRSNEVSIFTKNEPPPAVVLAPAAPDSSGGVVLNWSESTAHDFASYRLYRDVVPTVGTSSTLVVEIDDRDVYSFRDTELEASTTYYYRVFVTDDGETPGPISSGSNTVSYLPAN